MSGDENEVFISSSALSTFQRLILGNLKVKRFFFPTFDFYGLIIVYAKALSL